jgi:hypothetical protein
MKNTKLTSAILIVVTALTAFVSCKNDFVINILPTREASIKLHISGDVDGDEIKVSPDKGKEGDTVTLTCTVADTAFYNTLEFGGVSVTIASVSTKDKEDNGKRTYIINPDDASSGVITITAVFTHTDLDLDPIEFDKPGHRTMTYGDSFTNVIKKNYQGSGVITYSSSDITVATVNASGQVTARKTGFVVIIAEKPADAVYAHAQTNYTLTIGPRPVTITGLSAENKTYDGNTDATVTGTPVINGLVNGDTVTVIWGTAVFADAGAGDNKTVIFSGWSLEGKDKDNYILAQPEGTANIFKAPGAEVTKPTVSVSCPPTSDSITVEEVESLKPETGQSIEYAISTADDGTGLSAWQSGVFFDELDEGTTYYVYARSKSADNYEAGELNRSDAIETP